MNKEFACHYSAQTVYGSCPISRCWANNQAVESGCLFQHLGRKNITSVDLSLIHNQSEAHIKDRLNTGRRILALYFSLREEIVEKIERSYCPKCGIVKERPTPCIRSNYCKHRQILYEKQLDSYPLKHFEFYISRQRFYHVFTQEKFFNY